MNETPMLYGRDWVYTPVSVPSAHASFIDARGNQTAKPEVET